MEGVPVGVVAAVVDIGESAFAMTCVGVKDRVGLRRGEPEGPGEGCSETNGIEWLVWGRFWLVDGVPVDNATKHVPHLADSYLLDSIL